MKLAQIFTAIIAIVLPLTISAQTLSKGNYTSSDGRYTVIVEHDGNAIKITEPNKINLYKGSGSTKYFHSEAKYAGYYIRVAGTGKYYTGKTGSPEFLFVFSGKNTDEKEVLASGTDNCPLYDKYTTKISKDPENTHIWVYCAAAALAYCTYNVDKQQEMLTPIIKGLKSVLENTERCPCEDVIKPAIWKSVKTD
ncbi:MAG: hypothetical protein EOO90_13205 [Pedobacter sp.]|nr:MAG: hypothetical protein EOO90_13205 [Pedobacter sp.]